MKHLNLIAAVDKNWGIGKGGSLLVSIPQDKRFFREETLGKTIIMGRKTFEDLPGGRPLYKRTNIVLSEDPRFAPEGVSVLRSPGECLKYLKEQKIREEDVFIIGGESIYKAFLPRCDTAHITYIDYAYEADRFMPDLDRDEEWSLVLETEEETYFELSYRFRLYRRKG